MNSDSLVPKTDTSANFQPAATIPPLCDRVLPLFFLHGKTAIVSSGGNGVGLAVVHAFAEAGANVAFWYASNTRAADRAEEIERLYRIKCRAYQVDVTVYEEVEQAVDKVVTEFDGRLDIFVANAGSVTENGSILDWSVVEAEVAMRVNINSTLYCARAAGLHFRRQAKEATTADGRTLQNYRYGSFIANGSICGHIVRVPHLQTVYNSSKAAVIHMCKSLAVEWVGFARANSVSLGYIKNERLSLVNSEIRRLWIDRIPMGREGEANEVKGAYLYLASDASSYTTGYDLVVDGGYCLP